MIVMQFSRQNDIGSDLITWFSHGAGFSHVDTVMPDGRLLGARSDVCAGVPPGVQIRPVLYAPFSRTLRVVLPADDETTCSYYAFVEAQIGKPYDMRAIEAFPLDRDWRTPNAWFCSELNAAALEACRWFAWPLATPADKIDPDDLVLVVSTRVAIPPRRP